MSRDIKLLGRLFIHAEIKALTGLHIGDSSVGLEIGGIDKPFIRNPLTGRPYIPGSSLRGKMRSQLEKYHGLTQNNEIGIVKIHSCETEEEYRKNGGCKVCHIFGVSSKSKVDAPTLLVVRDIPMDDDCAEMLEKSPSVSLYGEIKTEVAIDRVTSAASPRTLERVPAGAVFSPAELVFSIYDTTDIAFLETVLDGLQLVEDDYLGGSGSRGSGQISLNNIKISARSTKVNYADLQHFSNEKAYDDLKSLLAVYPELEEWVKQMIAQG